MDLKVFKTGPGPEFEALLAKINDKCELDLPSNPPQWLDKDLFADGAQFFHDYFLIVVLSSIHNFLIGISIPNLW